MKQKNFSVSTCLRNIVDTVVLSFTIFPKLGGFMRVRGSTWKHKKIKGLYVGAYARTRKGKRVMVITSKSGYPRTYSSAESAKASGWRVVELGQ